MNLSVRYTAVPWLWQSDLDEGPRAVWDVGQRGDQERVSCWEVPLYEEGHTNHAYLVMHAIRGNGNDGGEITLSISGQPRYDLYAKDVLAVTPSQSHARRYVFRSTWERE